jgi:hypothetical protein
MKIKVGEYALGFVATIPFVMALVNDVSSSWGVVSPFATLIGMFWIMVIMWVQMRFLILPSLSILAPSGAGLPKVVYHEAKPNESQSKCQECHK